MIDLEQRTDGKVRWMSRTSSHGSGWVFGIHDVALRGGRSVRVAHESLEATHRVFVMADGSRWVYRFQSGEDRRLKPALLEVQIDAGRYVTGDATRANPR